MAVVSRAELHRYMSEPRWSDAQALSVDQILAAVEGDLCSALHGAKITPVARTDRAPVARATGRIETSLPVHHLLAVAGTVVDAPPPGTPAGETGPDSLPVGYLLADYRLTCTADLEDRTPLGLSLPRPAPNDVYSGYVSVTYMGGWGAHPTLVGAILAKAAVRVGRRHSNTMQVTGLNAEGTPSRQTPGVEGWTADEVGALGTFRNLGWGL